MEAQRLGLEAHASDLNPVAVLINKALTEIPPKFSGQPPVYPELADSEIRRWTGAEGLAADVRAYGQWMSEQAQREIGSHYPSAAGKPVIAWLWARTVPCPNPACGVAMPLVRSWWLSQAAGYGLGYRLHLAASCHLHGECGSSDSLRGCRSLHCATQRIGRVDRVRPERMEVSLILPAHSPAPKTHSHSP